MKLTKYIPAKVKIFEFHTCSKFMTFNTYLNARNNMKMKTKKSCWGCNHKFNNNEMLYLAFPKRGVNKLICNNCAKELHTTIKSGETYVI
jgi:hypothetical protein